MFLSPVLGYVRWRESKRLRRTATMIYFTPSRNTCECELKSSPFFIKAINSSTMAFGRQTMLSWVKIRSPWHVHWPLLVTCFFLLIWQFHINFIGLWNSLLPFILIIETGMISHKNIGIMFAIVYFVIVTKWCYKKHFWIIFINKVLSCCFTPLLQFYTIVCNLCNFIICVNSFSEIFTMIMMLNISILPSKIV